jgi:hypothetical protein
MRCLAAHVCWVTHICASGSICLQCSGAPLRLEAGQGVCQASTDKEVANEVIYDLGMLLDSWQLLALGVQTRIGVQGCRERALHCGLKVLTAIISLVIFPAENISFEWCWYMKELSDAMGSGRCQEIRDI